MYASYKNLGRDPDAPHMEFNNEQTPQPMSPNQMRQMTQPHSEPNPNGQQRQPTPLINIFSHEHKQELIKTHSLVVVDIYGDWCQPCKNCEPGFAALAAKYNQPGRVLLCKEDVDKKFSQGIRGVPAFHFFKNGQFVHSLTGGDLTPVEEAIQHLLQ